MDNYYSTAVTPARRLPAISGSGYPGVGMGTSGTMGNTGGPLSNAYKAYNAAATTQAGDYDKIMKGYQDYNANIAKQQPLTFTPYQYSPSSDVTASLSNYKNLSDTGGYSADDIAALRERGISPIRSIYASAQRDVDRQRSLQGGFSPNYAAVSAKMAREQADSISNQMNNVNAGIAQNVASNKIQATGGYASAAEAENAARMNAAQFNASMPLEYGKYNQGIYGQQLAGLEGMRGLYGTNPALMEAFGNQALQQGNLQNTIRQGNQNYNLNLIGRMVSGLG